ncbi:nucleotide pyrophosphohydrolase [Clostridium sporogenes]|uniref:MazG nucleotide pyrophosphohydrolase domain-containing protein n=1 Tax=Clostridium sporogenes TaxID=1509 RepID=UPI002237E161|nr:MazG nucleotide pyrophosphohydrolase domain-containing protein [Clostridium sporogenes]MCW6059749.1 nucleotide pyrophosphohydrolase [Clostridium sporogenes]MCW6067298.1 nucleotide pyrophosphohydrolase [Clostridium sporogenes]
MEIRELVEKAHKNAVDHGFWENWVWIERDKITGHKEHYYNAIGNMLMLITGEVAEAHEALRKREYENFKEELADIVIRVADLCGGLDIDLEKEIKNKMEKNKSRPYKHGKAF